MKKFFYFTIACLAMACTSLFLPSKANASIPEGNMIVCRCRAKISLLPKGCYVNTNGPICAQGEPGSNIQCSLYHGNCD